MTAPSPIQPAVGGMTDEEIKARCKAAGIKWIDAVIAGDDEEVSSFPGCFEVATLDEMRALLASTSPAQTGEPDAWQDPDCPRHVISKEDKRDFTDPAINGAVSRMNAERCTRPLFATRQTGGVDQAWVDKAMDLAIDYGVESLRVGSRERRDSILNNGVYQYDTVDIREKRKAARLVLHRHLSTALAGAAK